MLNCSFKTKDGEAEIYDFMLVTAEELFDKRDYIIHRCVKVTSGIIKFKLELFPRPEYASVLPNIEKEGNLIRIKSGKELFLLDMKLEKYELDKLSNEGVNISFSLQEKQDAHFDFIYGERPSDETENSVMKFSIIIPVLDEVQIINNTIKHIFEIKDGYDIEVIVVDGSPLAETNNVILDKRVVKLCSSRGRGKQMNRGAEAASGDALVFLHADTILPVNAFRKIESVLKDDEYAAGAFNLKFITKNLFLKFVSFTANIRNYLTSIPYGDQAVFIKKELFYQIGMYKDMPIMEDVDLMKRLKSINKNIIILKERVRTSPRRWNNNGIIITTLRHHIIRILYTFGVSPYKLSKFHE